MRSVIRLFILLMFLAGVVIFGHSAFAVTPAPTCLSIVTHNEAWNADKETLDNWLREDVDSVLTKTGSASVFPKSMPQISFSEKVKNNFAMRMFNVIRNLNSKKQSSSNPNKTFLESIAKATRFVRNSVLYYFLSGKVFERLEGMLNHPLVNENGNLSLKTFSKFQIDFMSDLKADQNKYGMEFLGTEETAQGAVNTFAIKLFAFLNNRETYSRQSANAISLLHPIVDAAMDKGYMKPETFKKLSDFLFQAQRPTIESHYEKILFDYLYRFEADFQRDKVPGFWLALSRLFSAQVKSMKQKSGHFNEREYYEMALDKGGLSTVLAAYTALGPLTKTQFEFFYRTGGVFQVIDDLIDIQKDQAENVQTIWTRALAQRTGFLRPTQHLLRMEKKIEDRLEELTEDFDDPRVFQTVYAFGFEMSFIRGMARQRQLIDNPTLQLLSQHLAVSLKVTEDLMSAQMQTPDSAQEGSDIWFLNHLVNMTNNY